jgi:hypothetical protein
MTISQMAGHFFILLINITISISIFKKKKKTLVFKNYRWKFDRSHRNARDTADWNIMYYYRTVQLTHFKRISMRTIEFSSMIFENKCFFLNMEIEIVMLINEIK